MYLLLAAPNLAKGSDLKPVLVLQIPTRSFYVTDTFSFSCSHLYGDDSNNYNWRVMQFHDLFKCTIFISTDSNHVKLVRYNLKTLCLKLQTLFEGVREFTIAQKSSHLKNTEGCHVAIIDSRDLSSTKIKAISRSITQISSFIFHL
jgi:hypothetical protein